VNKTKREGPGPRRTPAKTKPCEASLEAPLRIQEVRLLSSMAATIPQPTNKTPATAASKDPTDAPPVIGNAVALVPESSVVLAVAVGVALAVGVAVAVALDITSSPVALSSKRRAPRRHRPLRDRPC
jgi:hypothetical protein